MITYIPLDKETLSQDIITKFAKYDGRAELFEKKAFSIIKQDQHLLYLEVLEVLFISYNLPEHHFSNIHYIIGQHIFIYSALEEKRKDALEASEVLLFLKHYHLQNEELKQKYKRTETQVIEDLNRYVEFKTPNYPTAYPIKLHNIHFIAKGIYQLFRNQSYIHIKEKLASYEEIPPYEIVKELVNDNQFIVDYPDKYLLAQLIEDLLSYLETSDISYKYRFIFDLLFISQVFHLDSKASKDIEVITDNNRFDPFGIIPTYKTAYIKDIIKAHKIYLKRNQ